MRLANTVPLEAEVNQSCPSPRGRGKVMVVGNATSGRISQASSFPGFREQHSPLLALLPVRPRTPHAQSPPAAGWAPPPHQASQRRGCGGQPAMHCTAGGTSARSRSAAWKKHGRNVALFHLKPGKLRAGGCHCAQVRGVSQPLRGNAASLHAWSPAPGWLQCIHSVSTLQDRIGTEQASPKVELACKVPTPALYHDAASQHVPRLAGPCLSYFAMLA